MSERIQVAPGMDVYGSDGGKIGSIHGVFGDYMMVEKGIFFPKDYYIPMDAIQGVDANNQVYLTVSKDEALHQGWDAVPELVNSEYGYTSATTTSSAAVDTEVIAPDYVAESDVAASGADATRVPVYEEDLTAIKRPVDRGAVRIEKELVTEDRTITVPVTEERVRVTRVDAADASSPASTADAFQEGVIEVPVMGEEVDVQKTARLAGEVVVEKEAVQTDKRVSDSVRREEVRVDDATIAGSQADVATEPTNPLA